MRRRLPSVFDAFNSFDRTFTTLSKGMDDVFESFFGELYVEPEFVDEVKGERNTYINGMLVKKETSDGKVEHYQDGRLHNLSGPAVESKEGQPEYWIGGRQVSQVEHEKVVKEYKASIRSQYNVELNEEERKKIEEVLGRKLGE